MPSGPLSPSLIGEKNPKIRAVKNCCVWYRTKAWPAQLPAKASTWAPEKPRNCSFQHTELFGGQGTLGNLAPEGQEVQNQKWQNFEEQRHRRAFAQTGTWIRKMRDQESFTKAKAGRKRWIGITCSLAEWEWWGIRWANSDQVSCGITHVNNF